MQDAGNLEDLLTRIIVSRSEVDLVQIKEEFQRQSGRAFDAWIEVQQLLNTSSSQ